MTEYTPSNPAWSDSINVTDTSTPNNGDLIANAPKQLLNNEHVLKNTKARMDSIAGTESTTTASKAYAKGALLYLGTTLYKTTAAIAQGGTIVTTGTGRNATETTIEAETHATKPVAEGGTGATTAEGARENLGLGTVATINTGADETTFLRNDGTWAKPAGGGSKIRIFTSDSALMGGIVTISAGGSTITGAISNSGEAVFEGVSMTGYLTITATKGAASCTEYLTVQYYGTYEVEVSSGTKNTISISTDEEDLIGKTVTATYGGSTKSATISIFGTASINIYDYTGSVSISATDGMQTASASVTIISGTTSYSASLSFVKVYGAEWDGTATTAFSRTDDAENFVDPSPAVNNGTGSSPFDSCAPWKNIERRTDAEAGEVVYIPKFWVKVTLTGSKLKIQIADKEKAGFVPAPAFQDAGDGRGELDYILVGRYHCASDFKSKTGVAPHANITRSAFRTGIHALGTDVYQWDYAVRLTIFYLYLVEFADWNTQAKIGYGCGNNSSTQAQGATDSMQYHTGTSQASKTTYGVGVQYRYIEGLWDNIYDFVDGIYFSGTDVFIIKNPNNFSDSSGGTKIGTRPSSSNYISAWFIGSADGYGAFIYPSAVSGGESTYVCDYCDYNASGVVLFAGGNYDQYQAYGLFCLYGYYAASYACAYVGSRLLKKPSAA